MVLIWNLHHPEIILEISASAFGKKREANATLK
jgi:hypothetical protein